MSMPSTTKAGTAHHVPQVRASSMAESAIGAEMAAELHEARGIGFDAEGLQLGRGDHVPAAEHFFHDDDLSSGWFRAGEHEAPRERQGDDDDQHDREGRDRRVDVVVHAHPHEAGERYGV